MLALLFAYLAWVSVSLQVDTFDTFELFLNARSFAGRDDGWYFKSRSYGLPLIFSPVFYLESLVGKPEGDLALLLCHILSSLLFATTGFVVYRLLRLHFGKAQALAGVLILFTNRLVVHLAPFSRDDIPGMLFCSAAFYFYLRFRSSAKTKYLWLAIATTTMAMATRYNLIPLLPAVFGLHWLVTNRKNLASIAALTILPVAGWLVMAALLYWKIGRAELHAAPFVFFRELLAATRGAVGSEMAYPELPIENVVFLLKSFTPPVILLACAGLVSNWKKTPGLVFHGIWFAVFMAFHTFVLGHKEARYSFPFYPAVCFLALVGFNRVRPWLERVHRRAVAVTCLLLSIWPAYNAISECLRFRDPFYSSRIMQDTSRIASEAAGPNRVFWAGNFYAIHPEDYVFDLEDEVTYLYHFYVHQVRYFTGRDMMVLRPIHGFFRGQDPDAIVHLHPANVREVRDGDVVIMNLERSHYVTKDVPERLQALHIERASESALEKVELKETATEYIVSSKHVGLSPFVLIGYFSNGQTTERVGLMLHDPMQAPTLVTKLPKKNVPTGFKPVKFALLRFERVAVLELP